MVCIAFFLVLVVVCLLPFLSHRLPSFCAFRSVSKSAFTTFFVSVGPGGYHPLYFNAFCHFHRLCQSVSISARISLSVSVCLSLSTTICLHFNFNMLRLGKSRDGIEF